MCDDGAMDALFDGLSSPYVDLSAVVDQNGEVSAYDAHARELEDRAWFEEYHEELDAGETRPAAARGGGGGGAAAAARGGGVARKPPGRPKPRGAATAGDESIADLLSQHKMMLKRVSGGGGARGSPLPSRGAATTRSCA